MFLNQPIKNKLLFPIFVLSLVSFSFRLHAQNNADSVLYHFFKKTAPQVKFYNKRFSSDSLSKLSIYLPRKRGTQKEVHFSKIDSTHYFGVLNNFFYTDSKKKYAEEGDLYLFCLDANRKICLIFNLLFPSRLTASDELNFWPKKEEFMWGLIMSIQDGFLFNTNNNQLIRYYNFNFYQQNWYYNSGRGMTIDLYKKENKQYYQQSVVLKNPIAYRSAQHLLLKEDLLKFFELLVGNLNAIESSAWGITNNYSIVLKMIDKDYTPGE